MTGAGDWHRSFAIDEDRVTRFLLGPLELWVHRHPRDWTLTWRRSEDVMASALELDRPGPLPPEDARDVEVARYLCAGTADELAFGPRLADRPVVSRPEVPVIVQPSQNISLWISTPVWVRIAEMPEDRTLVELPVVRMSDSWAGTDTRSGTLCYATRTRARTSDFVEPHPVRAVTRVEVQNRDDSPLAVERINLPVPHLALHHGPRGWLTTELRVVRELGSRELSVQVMEGEPAGSHLVAAPRQASDAAGLLQGIQALLQ